MLGGVLHHAVLPVPDVALVPTDLPQSERLARLRLELQLEAADPAAVHVVVKDDLTLVVSAVPAEDIKTLPLTDHNSTTYPGWKTLLSSSALSPSVTSLELSM